MDEQENHRLFGVGLQMLVQRFALGRVAKVYCLPMLCCDGNENILVIVEGLVRLSVGIEDVQDIIADLE